MPRVPSSNTLCFCLHTHCSLAALALPCLTVLAHRRELQLVLVAHARDLGDPPGLGLPGRGWRRGETATPSRAKQTEPANEAAKDHCGSNTTARSSLVGRLCRPSICRAAHAAENETTAKPLRGLEPATPLCCWVLLPSALLCRSFAQGVRANCGKSDRSAQHAKPKQVQAPPLHEKRIPRVQTRWSHEDHGHSVLEHTHFP